MARFERTVTIDHEIGPSGSLRIRTIDGRVRLRGVDGSSARVTVTYRVRAIDDAAADRAVEEAEVRVQRDDGRLEIDTMDRRWSPLDVLGQLLSGDRVRVEFDVELPRAAAVQVDGVSAPVSGESLIGAQRYHTVSGELRLLDGAGLVDADSVSGAIGVFGTSELDLRARTISGRVQAVAARFRGVRVSTTSGGVDLAGTLDPGAEHRIDSVSGSVRLATDDGVTVDLRTLSGALRSALEGRAESIGGSRRVVVGDGAAKLRVSSVSGGVDVTGLRAAREPFAWRQAAGNGGHGSAQQPEAAAPTPPEAATPAAGPDPFAILACVSATGPMPSTPASHPAAPPEPAAPHIEGATAPTRSEGEEDLGILRALERGEISVEEAATRLAATRSAATRPAAVAAKEGSSNA